MESAGVTMVCVGNLLGRNTGGLDSKFYIPIQKLKFEGGLPLEILLDCNLFPLFESLDCNSGKTGTDTHPESPIQGMVQNWDLIDGPPIKLLEC